jgi:hypothetical protein
MVISPVVKALSHSTKGNGRTKMKSLNPKNSKPYESPRLIRQGHMSQVTKKSGPRNDVSPNWDTGKRQGDGPPEDKSPADGKGSSDDIFDNIFDG